MDFSLLRSTLSRYSLGSIPTIYHVRDCRSIARGCGHLYDLDIRNALLRFRMKPHVRHPLSEFTTTMKIMIENANRARDSPLQTLLSILPSILLLLQSLTLVYRCHKEQLGFMRRSFQFRPFFWAVTVFSGRDFSG